MKLYRVIAPVSDIEAAARFYSVVLGIQPLTASPGRRYFDCEGVVLACYDPVADGDAREAPQPLDEPLYFAVDDLEAVFARCAAAGAGFSDAEPEGVGPLGRITERPWGERSFYAEDPFGNALCFVERATAFTGDTLP